MNIFQRFYKWARRPNKSTFAQYVETFVIIVPIAFVIRTFFYGLYQVPTGSMETTMLVGGRFLADKFSPLIREFKRGDIISFNEPPRTERHPKGFVYSNNYWMNLFQQYVWGPSNWTKRIIGLPGDHVKGVIEDGKPVVYVNGKKLDEPYVNKYPLIGLLKNTDFLNKPCKFIEHDYRSYDPSYSYEDQPFYHIDLMNARISKQVFQQCGWPWMKKPYTPVYDMDAEENIINVDEYDVKLGPNEYWVMGDNRQGSGDSRMWGPLDRSRTLIHGKIIFCIFSLDSKESFWFLDLIKHPIAFWAKHMRWSRCLRWLK